MIYSGDLLKINNQIIPAIKQYKVGRNKLWKSSDRNMEGDVRGTLIGIFPKIEITTRPTTQEEMSMITQILDQDFFEVEYFDVRVQGTTIAKYYASDYDTVLLNKQKGLYNEMTVSLVPVSKRRY